MDANAKVARGKETVLARLGRTGSRPKNRNDALRLTIGVITLLLLATLVGTAPAILTAMYQNY